MKENSLLLVIYQHILRIIRVYLKIKFNEFSDNIPEQNPDHYGRTKEGYEGDTVTLTCSDESSSRGYVRVNFAFLNIFNIFES